MPNRRSLLFLALALLFGVAAASAARTYISQRTVVVSEPVALVSVATAAHPLSIGAALAAADLQLVEWPAAHLPAGAVGEPQRLEGRVLRRSVAAGELVLESALLPEGAAAGLPALISPQHRAISVKVDAVVGVAGFIKPGARVDVLATLRRAEAPNFSNVILQDVRVLAVDQTLEEVDDGKPEVVNVATLEVSTEEAERLVHAAHEGRLQLALRGPGDNAVLRTHAVRAQDLLGEPATPPPVRQVRRVRKPKPPGPSMELIRGTSVSKQPL